MASEKGRVLRMQGGFYFVETENGSRVAGLPGRHKRGDFSLLPGDQVRLEQQGEDSLIAERYPRFNFLERPGVANLNDLLVVASLKNPEADYLLMDRLLAVGLYASMSVAILATKHDLLEEGDRQLEQLQSYYRGTGFGIYISPDRDSMQAIRDHLQGRTMALAGNSGVGKSTFLNALEGEEIAPVQAVSGRLKRGRHTTRTVTLFPVAGGFIADSPGFNVLHLPKEMEPVQLGRLYPDYLPHLDDCRFSNCLHDREPGCAVRELVEAGNLSTRRHENYLRLLRELQELS